MTYIASHDPEHTADDIPEPTYDLFVDSPGVSERHAINLTTRHTVLIVIDELLAWLDAPAAGRPAFHLSIWGPRDA